jgi:hypothetical protein
MILATTTEAGTMDPPQSKLSRLSISRTQMSSATATTPRTATKGKQESRVKTHLNLKIIPRRATTITRISSNTATPAPAKISTGPRGRPLASTLQPNRPPIRSHTTLPKRHRI